MAQYPIPQFIEEEGKIIFFLTFKQFFMLVGAGAVSIILFLILPFYFSAIGSIIIMGSMAAIAFVKIDNASLLTVFSNFLGFTVGTKNYTWKKKEVPYPFKTEKKPQLTALQEASAPAKMQTSKLSDIKKLVETKR